MASIRVENVSKKYGDTEAVRNLSFEVPDGEFTVLLGPSGCGKTTLLRCIAGLERPDEGKIFIGDELANEISPRDRDISMVFQNYALFRHMTVFANIAFPLKVRNASKQDIDSRVTEVARLFGIAGLLEKRPDELSGGEQQRVALARAVIREPNAFLMDEPLSSLDAPLRIQLRAELKRIQKEIKMTVLYVTHDQAEALALADRVGVMNHGNLLQYASPEEVYSSPENSFVAGFVGNPPSNLIPVRLSDINGTNFLEGSGLRYAVNQVVASRVGDNNQELTMAIRPEDLAITTSRSGPNSVQATVYLTEPLGPNMIVHLKTGESVLKGIVPSSMKLALGQEVWFEFAEGKVRIFSRGDGKLIP